jgi:hypothetical protein
VMPGARVHGVVVQHAADVEEDHLDRHRARLTSDLGSRNP